MEYKKSVGKQLSFLAAAFAMVSSLILPTIVSADQATDRSIELSSVSASATNVTYVVNFKTSDKAAAGAFTVDFCKNSPLLGQTCTQPTDFSATAAASTTSGFTDVTGSANRVVVAGTLAQSTAISVELSGINNPSTTDPLYARIVTYDTKEHATAATPDNYTTGAIDEGGVAIAITPTIGVSGTVLESLMFCVSGDEIGADCATTGKAPVLTLGEQVGDVKALTNGVVSQGTIYSQISTNASSGAVVRLKSSASDCGGLKRAGAPTACDIKPATGTTGIDAGANEAKFGVKTADATSTGTAANGTLEPVDGSLYANSRFAMNYVEGNTTGVTSPFGDQFLDTAGAPANNKNMALTFGATVANNTPAGTYAADLSLIAVGKF